MIVIDCLGLVWFDYWFGQMYWALHLDVNEWFCVLAVQILLYFVSVFLPLNRLWGQSFFFVFVFLYLFLYSAFHAVSFYFFVSYVLLFIMNIVCDWLKLDNFCLFLCSKQLHVLSMAVSMDFQFGVEYYWPFQKVISIW